MKKTKHNPPGKPKPHFIQFSKVQQGFIGEVVNRQRRELGEALQSVYEELGIIEKVMQSPPGTYRLKEDCSGLDIIPAFELRVEEKTEAEEPAKETSKADN